MEKATALVLSFALMLTLTACSSGDTGSTTTGTTTGTTTNTGTTGNSSTVGNGTGTGSGVGEMIGGAIDDMMGSKLPFDDGASVMVGGKLYQLSGEIIRTDELGTQLLSTSTQVLGTPAADGEGFGVSKQTKIYEIKNNTTKDAVAVEVEGVYYRATLKTDGGNTGSAGTTTSSTATSDKSRMMPKVTTTKMSNMK